MIINIKQNNIFYFCDQECKDKHINYQLFHNLYCTFCEKAYIKGKGTYKITNNKMIYYMCPYCDDSLRETRCELCKLDHYGNIYYIAYNLMKLPMRLCEPCYVRYSKIQSEL